MPASALLITSGAADGSISLCDLRSGETTTSWKGNFSANGVCVLGPASVAAAQADRASVQFLSVQGQAQQRALVAETLTVLAATTDGQYLSGGSASGTIYLWEVASGRLLLQWPAHYKGITALLFVCGSSLLVSGGEDTLVHAWLLPDLLDPSLDLDRAAPLAAQPKPLHSWCDHTLQVTALVAGVGEAAAVLASASLDRTVKLRRLADGCQLRSVALPAAINDIVLDSGEEMLYAAGGDGVVYGVPLIDDGGGVEGRGAQSATAAAAGRALSNVQDGSGGGGGYLAFVGHSRPVTCLVLAALDPGLDSAAASAHTRGDGVLMSGSEDGTVRIWDIHSRQALQVIAAPGKAPVKSVRALPYLLLGTAPQHKAHASSHGAQQQQQAPLSKYSGPAAGGRPWQGAVVRVDGSEPLPQGGLLRPGRTGGQLALYRPADRGDLKTPTAEADWLQALS